MSIFQVTSDTPALPQETSSRDRASLTASSQHTTTFGSFKTRGWRPTCGPGRMGARRLRHARCGGATTGHVATARRTSQSSSAARRATARSTVAGRARRRIGRGTSLVSLVLSVTLSLRRVPRCCHPWSLRMPYTYLSLPSHFALYILLNSNAQSHALSSAVDRAKN